MTRSLSRRILLKSAVVSSLLGATVGGAALQPTGSRRPQPEARRIAAAKPGGPGTFEVLPRGEESTLVCTEVWYLPYGYLGVAGWFLCGPFVEWGLRKSLQRFARLAARRG